MHTLSLLDLGFFLAETEASPKHVAGLLIFKRPARAPDFARKLYREYLASAEVTAPFNRIIRLSITALPQWLDAPSVDLAQHVFFHKLPGRRNGRQALFDTVARLHEPRLDRSRPLWQLHVIEGFGATEFALYYKVHHAYADGVTMTKWLATSLSESAAERGLQPLWTTARKAYDGAGDDARSLSIESAWRRLGRATEQAAGMSRLATMLLLERLNLTHKAIALPFAATERTPLTGQVSAARRFASTSVSLQRINALRERTRATLNHVALTCLDGALHRYLHALGVEMQRPITIQMPVNLRRQGDRDAGNKLGIIPVELSAPTDDPSVRLRNIGRSLRRVRKMIDRVAPSAIETYSLVIAMAAQGTELLKLSDRLPPLGHTLVSNVPGPRRRLYLNGAALTELHPISTLPPGNLLNITLFSYVDHLHFGLIATEDLPDLPGFAAYIDQAFVELEAAVLGTAAA